MTIVIFSGPTLCHEDGREILDAVYKPPVVQGELYREARKHPMAIGIVDGHFQRVPAVWHKEILWAMAEGVHVFGAASMGALRAAELCDFGMEGVGEVFQKYRAGTLEDDDEVAVAHGPSQMNWRPCTDAMVNIRHTFTAAVSDGVIGESTASKLIELGKALFYPERTYARILELAAGRCMPAEDINQFRTWLPNGRIDQKRRDAIAMLSALVDWRDSDPEPKKVAFSFENSDMWARFVEREQQDLGSVHEQTSSWPRP